MFLLGSTALAGVKTKHKKGEWSGKETRADTWKKRKVKRQKTVNKGRTRIRTRSTRYFMRRPKHGQHRRKHTITPILGPYWEKVRLLKKNYNTGERNIRSLPFAKYKYPEEQDSMTTW